MEPEFFSVYAVVSGPDLFFLESNVFSRLRSLDKIWDYELCKNCVYEVEVFENLEASGSFASSNAYLKYLMYKRC